MVLLKKRFKIKLVFIFMSFFYLHIFKIYKERKREREKESEFVRCVYAVINKKLINSKKLYSYNRIELN
jgi:hypothetical protein